MFYQGSRKDLCELVCGPKGFVFGIILLFVGASISSGINHDRSDSRKEIGSQRDIVEIPLIKEWDKTFGGAFI